MAKKSSRAKKRQTRIIKKKGFKSLIILSKSKPIIKIPIKNPRLELFNKNEVIEKIKRKILIKKIGMVGIEKLLIEILPLGAKNIIK